MSKTIVVGSETFNYPTSGSPPGYGEDATDCVAAIAAKLSDIAGVNDINLTSAIIIDNKITPTNILGLAFDPITVKAFQCTYMCTRTDGVNTFAEEGTLYATFDGSVWIYNNANIVGNAGIELIITPLGQVQYYSTSIGGTYSGTLYFRAKTIDQV